ncbi:hypothetical protein Y032_0017g3215 [Ancylostoma ceylanicum]|uniref:Uncharacterized protein n=1 Tax=Ancylostoma ceylanicum TaxID=53326 RepID=A0A016V3G8_9BILA|nr:hypothetical protein Y032_0017g3215 [Ancylostoma ceylanicum]
MPLHHFIHRIKVSRLALSAVIVHTRPQRGLSSGKLGFVGEAKSKKGFVWGARRKRCRRWIMKEQWGGALAV